MKVIFLIATAFVISHAAYSQTIVTDIANNPIEGFGLVKDPNSDIVYFGKIDSITNTAIYKGVLSGGKISSISKNFIVDNKAQETIPFFSADGKYIFLFTNANNASKQNIDLWFGKYSKKGRITDLKKAPVSTDSVDYYGSMSANGNIYFSSWRSEGTGKGDIFSAGFKKGKFNTSTHLDATINNRLTNSSPAISPNEAWMIYYNENENTKGGDLVISFAEAGKWSKPIILPGSVNTLNFEFAPVIADNGNMLYFSRREQSGNSGKEVYHIYKVPVDELKLDNLKLTATY